MKLPYFLLLLPLLLTSPAFPEESRAHDGGTASARGNALPSAAAATTDDLIAQLGFAGPTMASYPVRASAQQRLQQRLDNPDLHDDTVAALRRGREADPERDRRIRQLLQSTEFSFADITSALRRRLEASPLLRGPRELAERFRSALQRDQEARAIGQELADIRRKQHLQNIAAPNQAPAVRNLAARQIAEALQRVQRRSATVARQVLHRMGFVVQENVIVTTNEGGIRFPLSVGGRNYYIDLGADSVAVSPAGALPGEIAMPISVPLASILTPTQIASFGTDAPIAATAQVTGDFRGVSFAAIFGFAGASPDHHWNDLESGVRNQISELMPNHSHLIDED